MARLAVLAALAVALALPPAAAPQVPGAPVTPIPGGTPPQGVPELSGEVAVPDPVRQRWRVPQHPFMAENPNSNLHNDAYMTDAYDRSGPLGNGTTASSALFGRECASVTFDSAGRIVTVCVGLDRPVLAMLDPATLAVLASFELPPRPPSGNAFSGFAGGGYFYLDDQDRAVIPTSTGHVFVVAETEEPGFELVADHDASAALAGDGDAIVSVLPDWNGRLWFASVEGRVGFVDPASGRVAHVDVGARIHNSFAVDETGGVFVVSDEALYRFEARRNRVRTVWERRYPNVGEQKPGQTQAGSGTTPTLIAKRNVAITDNGDPMRVQVYRRSAKSRGRRVCREPVFEAGASATDQSLIAAGRSLIVENNYGYTGPGSVMNGMTTTPGLQRVNVRRGRCRARWTSDEIAPSVVPKVSLGAGLVYTYTKPPSSSGDDFWYFTALDFDDGRTVFTRFAGEGFGHNNNFAPVTIGPDGSAYVGVLGGLIRFRDSGSSR